MFVRWNVPRTPVGQADVVRTADELARTHRRNVVLVMSYRLGVAGQDLIELGTFDDSIVMDERYTLYLRPFREEPVEAGGQSSGGLGRYATGRKGHEHQQGRPSGGS